MPEVEENYEEPEVDPDLLDENDAEEVEVAEQKPKKKRGRKKKKDQPTAVRPFIESGLKQTMAQNDIADVVNRFDWDSGEYDALVTRQQPQVWKGRNVHGYIASFTHAVDEDFIRENFGGGVFDIRIRGPHPRTGRKGFLTGTRIKVSGDPIISPIERDRDGGGSVEEPPVSSKSNPGKKNNGEDWAAPDPAYKWLEKREAESASEAAKLRERLFEEATKKRDNGTASDKAMQYIKETTDRAIEAERRSSERLQEEQEKTRQEFERLASRMQNSGIPPEMLQTLTEQHRSEMNALNESRIVQLQQTQDRYEHELKSLRERYEREISNIQDKHNDALTQIRGDMQGRLDRTEEQYKREMDRNREESERRYDKLNEDWQRRFEQEKQDSRSDRESLDRHNSMQSEHMKSLHESQVRQLEATLNGQLAQERSQHDSALAQQKAQYDAQLKMQETSFQSRVDSLSNELERIRGDLTTAQAKIMDQGDLASQAKKIRDVNESLGAVFGLGGASTTNVLSDVDVEPKQEEPKTWWGKLMQFADSPLGEGAFDFLRNMAAGATGMYPMMPGLPGGQPPGYGPPPYQPPPQPTYAPPQPSQPPYPSVYEPTPESVAEPGVVTGQFVDEEAEPAGPAPETPQVEGFSIPPADPSGAFGGVADPKGPEITPEEVESLHNQDVQPQPVQPQQPQPQPQPQPAQVTEIPPEIAEQLRGFIEGLEGSMSTNVEPHVLAGTIIKMAPREQVVGLVQAPVAQFIATIQQIAPESMLLTYQGRKYIAALQQSLAQQLQQQPA